MEESVETLEHKTPYELFSGRAEARKADLTWDQYELLLKHYDWALQLATRALEKLKVTHITLDDVSGKVLERLLKSVQRYDKKIADVTFKVYVSTGIFGSVLDWIREWDFIPRSKRLTGSKEQIVTGTVSLKRFRDVYDYSHSESNIFENNDLVKFVIGNLNTEERLIIELHYFEGQTLKEIGKFLGMAERNVSRAHKKVKTKLKKLVEKQIEHTKRN